MKTPLKISAGTWLKKNSVTEMVMLLTLPSTAQIEIAGWERGARKR